MVKSKANVAQLNVFRCEARFLKKELFDLQPDTDLKTLLEEKTKAKDHCKL